jgi:SAM-dependent methyltransferase
MDTKADEREAFLAEQRETSRRRYDQLHSANYDALWGDVEPLHATFVKRVARALPRGARVLDAACGTGKYWPCLFGAGVRVLGIDQSTGMLARAREKHPEVPTRAMPLQDLAGSDELGGGFDAVICVDAMEFVGPEDWPRVLSGFAHALRDGGLLYLTVEQPEIDGDPETPTDPRQLPGESTDGGGYHHYPSKDRVLAWLTDAGFGVEDQAEGEWYWHLLTRQSRPSRSALPGTS